MIFPLENRDVKPSESKRKLILQSSAGICETYDDRRLNIINLHSCLLSTVSIFIYFRSAEKSMFFPRKWRKDRMLSPQFRLFPFIQSFFGSHYVLIISVANFAFVTKLQLCNLFGVEWKDFLSINVERFFLQK